MGRYGEHVPFTAFRDFELLPAAAGERLGPPRAEEQNTDYEAGLVAIGAETWRIRTARVTPTKPGAFVAVWRRDDDGVTRPFVADEVHDGLLVFVRDGTRFGVFRFTPAHLTDLGVTRTDRSPGKRGFRVYPNWCDELNAQAVRTQVAQSAAFTLLSFSDATAPLQHH